MTKTVSVVAAAVLVCSAWSASAAGTDTPRIDARQAKQEQRIDQGIASGELTKREARRMNRQQSLVDSAENKSKADGVMTAQERRRLTKAQNATSRRIYRQKPGGALEILIEDRAATTIAHPTNVALKGNALYTANLGRWHITAIDLGA